MSPFAFSVIPSGILAIVMLPSLPAMAAPPDLTAGGTPATTKSLKFDPTGNDLVNSSGTVIIDSTVEVRMQVIHPHTPHDSPVW